MYGSRKARILRRVGFAASVGADYAGNAAFADPQIVDIKGLGPFPIAVGEISYLINDPGPIVFSGHTVLPGSFAGSGKDSAVGSEFVIMPGLLYYYFGCFLRFH